MTLERIKRYPQIGCICPCQLALPGFSKRLLPFAPQPQTGEFGHSVAGLDEDTSTWTGQEEYTSSSSFMAVIFQPSVLCVFRCPHLFLGFRYQKKEKNTP